MPDKRGEGIKQTELEVDPSDDKTKGPPEVEDEEGNRVPPSDHPSVVEEGYPGKDDPSRDDDIDDAEEVDDEEDDEADESSEEDDEANQMETRPLKSR